MSESFLGRAHYRIDRRSKVSLRSLLRRSFDSWAPAVGLVYRAVRDARAAERFIDTPFGFRLAGSEMMATGVFEPEELRCFQERLTVASICVDVGANVGLYSCIAASRGKHVVAVEPAAANVKTLLNNFVANGFHDVEVYPVGLAGAPGVAALYGSGTGASFVKGWASTSEGRAQAVPLSTLDVLVQPRFEGLPILIKIDVEGYELEVLRGAGRTLTMAPKPTWMVEVCLDEHFPQGVNGGFGETFEMFWDSAYQCRIADSSLRIVRPGDVKRWVTRGSVDFGSHNYLFEPV